MTDIQNGAGPESSAQPVRSWNVHSTDRGSSYSNFGQLSRGSAVVSLSLMTDSSHTAHSVYRTANSSLSYVAGAPASA